MKYLFIAIIMFGCGKADPVNTTEPIKNSGATFAVANGISIGSQKTNNATTASLSCQGNDTLISGTCVCYDLNGKLDVTRRKDTYDRDNTTFCECNEISTIQIQIYCNVR